LQWSRFDQLLPYRALSSTPSSPACITINQCVSISLHIQLRSVNFCTHLIMHYKFIILSLHPTSIVHPTSIPSTAYLSFLLKPSTTVPTHATNNSSSPQTPTSPTCQPLPESKRTKQPWRSPQPASRFSLHQVGSRLYISPIERDGRDRDVIFRGNGALFIEEGLKLSGCELTTKPGKQK